MLYLFLADKDGKLRLDHESTTQKDSGGLKSETIATDLSAHCCFCSKHNTRGSTRFIQRLSGVRPTSAYGKPWVFSMET